MPVVSQAVAVGSDGQRSEALLLVEDGPRILSRTLSVNFFRNESGVIFQLAWPSIISALARGSMTTIETAFVGHITEGQHTPKDYLTASTLTFMILGILWALPICCIDGITSLASQALGAGEKKMAGTWFQLSLFWTVWFSVPTICGFFFVGDVLWLLGFPPVICELSAIFARYNVFWVIPRLCNGLASAYFKALGIPRPAMYNDLIFACVHVLVNWVFVFGGPFRGWLGWQGLGFIGAGLSISITRTLEAVSYFGYMFGIRKAHLETWPGWNFEFLHPTYTRRFLQQCLPNAVSLAFRLTIEQATTFMIASLGVLAVAANSAVSSIVMLFVGVYFRSMVPVMGQRIGFHLGAGHPRAARSAALVTFGVSVSTMAVLFCLLFMFRGQVVSLMISDVEVQGLARRVMPYVLLSQMMDVLVFLIMNGVLMGQGRTKLAAKLSAMMSMPCSIGTIAFLVFWCHADLQVVIMGSAAASFAQAVVLAIFFWTSDWQLYAQQAQERQAVQT